jgi:hypothetical protein
VFAPLVVKSRGTIATRSGDVAARQRTAVRDRDPDTERQPTRRAPEAAAHASGKERPAAWSFANVPLYPKGRSRALEQPSPPAGGPIQRKLKVGAAGDRLEHEADRVADQVMRMPAATGSVVAAPVPVSRNATGAGLALQRKCACGGASDLTNECSTCRSRRLAGLQTKLRIDEPGDAYEQEADRIAGQVASGPAPPGGHNVPLRIQRAAPYGNGCTDAAPASVDRALASPGTPLAPALRLEMERSFGYDFSSVRVHSDAAAAQSTRDVDAHAYAVGHDIVFGDGRFAPETPQGRRLIAHELTHVVQQSKAIEQASTRVQRYPNAPAAQAKSVGEPKKNAKQVSFQIRFTGSLTREQFIDLAETTIYGHRTPGDWLGIPDHYKAEASPVTVWVPASTVESESRKGIDALRPDIKEFLMKRRPARSYADLSSLLRAGQILELNGVTEDELLLLDYRRGAESPKLGQKSDPVEWAQQVAIDRLSATEKALTNRATLIEAIGRLEYLSPHEKQNLKDVREGMFGFDTIDNILIYHDNLRTAPLIEEFEFELESITKAFLAQSQVALLRIEKTYLANKDLAREKEALRRTIAMIRPAVRQRDKAAHEEGLQTIASVVSLAPVRKAILGTPDTELDRARENLEKADERLKQQSKAAGLEVAGWEKFDLNAIRGTDIEVSRNHLRYFVDDARSTLAKAEAKTQDIKNLYKADRMLALTKAAIGIKDGSPMDDIIAARARQATSDSSFWGTVWDVVTFALMFVPGNIGIALRVGAGLVNAAEAVDKLSEGTLMHEAGLASQAPSSLGVVLAIGGTLIDAQQMAKGVFKISEDVGIAAKFGAETSATESTLVREGEGTGIRAGEDVAEQQTGKALAQGDAEIAGEAREISEEAADRMTTKTYSGGGHDFKVLENGRVVRCSAVCGDADELLIEQYEDVIRANPHLHADLERLTRLIATDPDQAAKLAAELEERCARLSGSAFETGPARAVGRAEDVGGALQPTTPGRAGIVSREGDAARRELRSNMPPRPGGPGQYQAHHIIPYELRNHPLVDEMRRGFNFNINGRGNGVWLPTQEALSVGAEALHFGSHARYTEWVWSELDQLAARYANGEIAESQIQREFEDLIGKFENVARSSSFGRLDPATGVVRLR